MSPLQKILASVLTLAVCALAAPEANAKPPLSAALAALPASTADHSQFKELQREFESGSELTRACLSCHNQAAKQVHASKHWKWEFVNGKTGQTLGKRHVVNNTLMSIAANGPYCARCHISNEWTEAKFDFTDPNQVDCLACHDTTGTYTSMKMHQLRSKCSACHVEFDKSKARNVVRRPDFGELGRHVGKPSLQTCGACHFNSDGGNGIKHGDLDSSLLNAAPELDAHMAKDGAGLTCFNCHKTRRHQTLGSRYAPQSKDPKGKNVLGGSRATCESCHGLAPHPKTANAKLNDHVDRIACQTCHIPAIARGGVPTKTRWDWSSAGRLDKAGKEIITRDDKGRIIYSTQRGSAEWAENLVPDYVWFNGEVKYLTLNDKINPAGTVRLNVLSGGPDDPKSRIWPVKTLRGKQPIDAENATLVGVRLFGKDENAFWEAYDWNKAIAASMADAGRPFSGKVGFVETEMRIPVNHMVAPESGALSCGDCHSRNGRMATVPGIYYPGRGIYWLIDLLGLLLVGGALAGVLAHGALRIAVKFRKSGKA
ncbi:MAG: cytochrome C [Hyphomicrobiales bacterium]|nr:MAG: cytochrome C [Hyphomicrobiales bacterium]